MNPLVTTTWLKENIGNTNLRILDVRFLLGQASAGHDAFVNGHIPGAIFLDLEKDLSGKVQINKTGGRHPLPNPETLAALLAARGIGNAHEIVCYDDPSTGQGFYAAHAWWLLRWLGHERVRVLNGGIAAWLKNGGIVETQTQVFTSTTFKINLQAQMVVNADDVQQRNSDTTLVDSRAAARYRGEVEPIDPVAGHIPGAINLDWASALNEDGEFLETSAQRQRSDAIVQQQRSAEILGAPILYCGSGVSACANVLAFAIAGKETKLYAGSWSDWVSDDSRPVEKTPA